MAFFKSQSQTMALTFYVHFISVDSRDGDEYRKGGNSDEQV
jgi:hypothetical protein